MRHEILLGLTTTQRADWKSKVGEIDEYGIKQIALFPTVLNFEERKELYHLLESTCLERVPHVHLRDDAEKWELDFLISRFGTEVFNIHSHVRRQTLEILKNKKYRNRVFLENCEEIDQLFMEVLKNIAGICLDAAHWADMGRLQGNSTYANFEEILNSHMIGCSHISALGRKAQKFKHYITGKDYMLYSKHYLEDLEELEYLRDYIGFLPFYISIELENSLRE